MPEKESTTAVTLGTSLNIDLTKRLELKFDYSAQVGLEDATNTNTHLLTLFSFEVFKDFDLDLTFVWDRVGNPPPDADGNVPEKDDFRYTIGIGWEF